MTTTVDYHVGQDGVSRPAINVKDHNGGTAYATAGTPLYDGGGDMPDLIGVAYDRIASDFWQAASEIAEQRGLGEIAQEGRSGGWLVFTDGRDPRDPESFCADTEEDGGAHAEDAIREWLAAYRAMVEWSRAWIADAPRKVAALAQQYAMDRAGEDAARRVFGTYPDGPFARNRV